MVTTMARRKKSHRGADEIQFTTGHNFRSWRATSWAAKVIPIRQVFNGVAAWAHDCNCDVFDLEGRPFAGCSLGGNFKGELQGLFDDAGQLPDPHVQLCDAVGTLAERCLAGEVDQALRN